jgi:hypothetical protein
VNDQRANAGRDDDVEYMQGIGDKDVTKTKNRILDYLKDAENLHKKKQEKESSAWDLKF